MKGIVSIEQDRGGAAALGGAVLLLRDKDNVSQCTEMVASRQPRQNIAALGIRIECTALYNNSSRGGLSLLILLKRTQGSLKITPVACLDSPVPIRTHGPPPGKSAVCGLNGHRLYYIIPLFKVTYESTIQVSRNFHALFTKTLENSDTCD